MAKYECTLCGYIYDEEKEGVKFADLPDDWTCPDCGADKSNFELKEGNPSFLNIFKTCYFPVWHIVFS